MGLTFTDASTKKLKGSNFTLLIIPIVAAATPQYATGGQTVDLKKYVNKDPVSVLIKTSSGYLLQWNKVTGKIMLLYYDYNNAADGPAIEFLNATDYPAGLVADAQIELWAFYAS